jgi:hypothetical protein
MKDELSRHVSLINPHWHEYISDFGGRWERGRWGSSKTNLCREWSSCSRDGRRGRIHVGWWPEAAGSSSWPGMTSKDLRQPSLGWSDVHPHASNCVLVIVVTQGEVGLEKRRAAAGRDLRRRAGRLAAAVGRMRALWICLARSRIWTARVTVFNETIGISWAL